MNNVYAERIFNLGELLIEREIGQVMRAELFESWIDIIKIIYVGFR